MAQDSLRRETDSTAMIDTSVPHSARIWNYWLGGKDNYPVDHAAGDAFRAVFPGITDLARDSRAFLGRAVTFLAGEAGIRQFLDIGTGLPTADNTHEIAQRTAPDARVVYVDNDPLVLTHARALLTSTPERATDYVDSDLHDPATVLRQAARTLDLSRPVALTMMQVSGHIADYAEARAIVGALLDALPSGSWSPSTTAWTRTRRTPRPPAATTRAARSPTTCAVPPNSRDSSTGWSCRTPGWCR